MSRDVVQIGRDSFARSDSVRKLIPKEDRGKCAFCGQKARFIYGTRPDSVHGRVSWHAGEFCSISCHNAYHH